MRVTVTGKIDPPNRVVLVNGVKAHVQSSGEWLAKGVPLSEGGVAIFDVSTSPESEQTPTFRGQTVPENSEIIPVESVSIKTAYAPAEMILNTTEPTYGTFKIHLTGTEGQSFVLQDSTNLVDWTSILTNLNSGATFDYFDTNVVIYGCRFFRVVPVR